MDFKNLDEEAEQDQQLQNIDPVLNENQDVQKRLLMVSLICFLFILVEVAGGFLANSLAIMTDAAHLCSDISGFFISIISVYIAQIPASRGMTYEIIGALSSVLLIWGLTLWLLSEAYKRILSVQQVDAKIMLITSCMGLAFNLVMMKVLHGHGHGHSHDHDDHHHEDVKIHQVDEGPKVDKDLVTDQQQIQGSDVIQMSALQLPKNDLKIPKENHTFLESPLVNSEKTKNTENNLEKSEVDKPEVQSPPTNQQCDMCFKAEQYRLHPYHQEGHELFRDDQSHDHDYEYEAYLIHEQQHKLEIEQSKKINQDHQHEHQHEHHDHQHEHDLGHEHNHSHGDGHNCHDVHSNDKDHEHNHGDGHKHEQKTSHDHAHDCHGHSHSHDHDHQHDNSHNHDHGHQHNDGHNHNHDHSHENMNVRAAMIHLIGDTVQSIGVILAAIVIYFEPEWTIVDPICTVMFSILVIFTTMPITRDCIKILMEGVPRSVQTDKLLKELLNIPNVLSVHHLHIWAISTKKISLSVHITSRQTSRVLAEAHKVCQRFDIQHPTIQIENPDDDEIYNTKQCEKSSC